MSVEYLRDMRADSNALIKKNLNREKKYIDFGWPILNEATFGYDHGVFIIAAPANLGKSAFLVNLYMNILRHNDDVFVLDFSLDDTFEDRVNNILASLTKIPINWVKYPKTSPKGTIDTLKPVYNEWVKTYTDRLNILDEDSCGGTVNTISRISNIVRSVAKDVGGKKLIVTVDGFHDVEMDGVHLEEYEQQKQVSKAMKRLADEVNCIVIATAHTPKGSMRRGLSQESVKGGTRISYDAKIIATIFSDYKINRGLAEIYHEAYMPYDPNRLVRMPVIELDIAKNKTAAFSDVIYYKFYPEIAFIEEADDKWQQSWRSTVYGEG